LNLNLSKIYLSILLAFLLFSCEEAEDSDASNNQGNQNSSTLDGDLNGQSLNLMDDLFYDFNANLDYTYNYYSVSGIGSSNTIEYPCLIAERDTFDFYTFPEYLIEAKNCSDPSIVCEESDNYENYLGDSLLDESYGAQCSCSCIDEDGLNVDCGANDAVGRSYNLVPTSGSCQDVTFGSQADCELNGWIWFSENIDCSLMDVNQDCIMDEEQESDLINLQTLEVSIDYTRLVSFVWSDEFGRYDAVAEAGDKLFNISECENADFGNQADCELNESIWSSISESNDTTLIDVSDIYNTTNYWAVINEWEDINGMAYIDHNQWKDTTIVYEEQPLEGQENADVVIDATFTYTRTQMSADSLAFRKNSDCNNDGVWTAAEEYSDFGTDGCVDSNESGYPDYNCGPCIVNTVNDTDGDGICDDDPNNDNWESGYDTFIYTENNNKYDEGELFTDRLDNLLVSEIFYDKSEGIDAEGQPLPGNGTKDANEPWADLNCNGIYDEESENSGNGIWDNAEIYQDSDMSGNWSVGEPLYDMSSSPNQIIVDYDTNDDGIVDELDGAPRVISEIYLDDLCLDENHDGGTLCESNGNEEPNEPGSPGAEDVDFIDYNDDGVYNNIAYENLIMVYLNGGYVSINSENLSLGGIIEEKEIQSYHYTSYSPIDEIKTVYYNEIIEDIPSDLITDDYFVTKTYWDTYPSGTDGDGDGLVDRYYDYDYHLFRYTDSSDDLGSGHLAKLVHPAYFYHYGYFETPEEIESGFYEIADFKQDIMIYTADGLIREGESVTSFDEVVVDANNDGVSDMQYEVSKEFSVEYEEAIVPLRKVLGTTTIEGELGNICSEGLMITCSDGIISCPDAGGSEYGEDNCGERIRSLSDCSIDTTINAFKIINTKNITMIGNGVEFGERNTVWLAQGIGIIADKLEHRWTENTDTYDWKEFSRLELKSQTATNEGTNLFRNLFDGHKVIHFDDFENEAPFNGDTFNNIKPTGIIQRSKTTYE